MISRVRGPPVRPVLDRDETIQRRYGSELSVGIVHMR